MLPENKIVRGVWFGPKLTNIQKLCIRSYQDNGHEFHLYTSEPTEGIPAGTIVHRVEEIVPLSDRDRFICASHFSDWVRINMIYQLGGWYVDLDTWCLKPLDFDAPYVFVSEAIFGAMRNPKEAPIPPPTTYISTGKTPQDHHHINGCIFKAPKNSPFLQWIIDRLNSMDTKALKLPQDWIAVGPQMFRDAVKQLNYHGYVQPPVVFDGVSPNELYHIISDGVKWDLNPCTKTIHVRSSAWKAGSGLDPDKTYPEDSLFEILKKKHGVSGEKQVTISAQNLANIVQPYTMAGKKINLVIDLASRLDAENVAGDVVECGTCNGGAGAVLAHFAASSRFNRRTWLFDSFEGLPGVTKEDLPETHSGRPAQAVVGQCVGSIEVVKEVLDKVGADMSRVRVIKGWFKDTFPTVNIKEIAMLNLDSDWYDCETLCWNKFYDQVMIGGYIYLDDFYYWPGCQQAAKDFFRNRKNEFPQKFNTFDHSVWIKKQSQEELGEYWAKNPDELRAVWGRW
jgi:hypothetical protein